MAANAFVKFNTDQARRIARSVRAYEKTVRNGRPSVVGPLGDRIPNVSFMVLVTKDGGSAGSAIADCSFTYTCTTLNGDATLGTSKTPTKNCRAPLTKYAPPPDGSVGAGYFDEEGVFQLWDPGEVLDLKDC